MKTFLSAILIFLASIGFTAELVQLDKLTTEIKVKESCASEENSKESKTQNDIDEKMSFFGETSFVHFVDYQTHFYYQANFTEGFISSLFNPPDYI